MEAKKLARVFALVKELAVALRMNSAYSHDINPYAADDVMWLSDALHNLGYIEKALEKPEMEIENIEALISTYQEYLEPKLQYKSVALETFNRWNVDIQGAINLFESLK